MNKPASKPETGLSVSASVHMTALLEKAHVCKAISRSYDSLREVLMQLQCDITTEDNRDTVGPTILAMKHINDILLVFKTKGDVFIQQEEQKKQ
jgi:hypothetical protein